MITIETPPRMEGKEEQKISDLRAYLYRMINDLQTQLNQLADRVSALENKS